MRKSEPLSEDEKLERASKVALQQIAELRFGKNGPKKPFMGVVTEFLQSSTDFERDNAYIGNVYKAISHLSNLFLKYGPDGIIHKTKEETGKDHDETVPARDEIAKAKKVLEGLLYSPNPNERRLSPGMQTPKLFIDDVCKVAEKVRADHITGQPLRPKPIPSI